MATTSIHQLFLLADHLKLSLLERQRSISLNQEPTQKDTDISRSLSSLQQGITQLESQTPTSTSSTSDLTRLKKQYETLSSQFTPTSSSIPTQTHTRSRPLSPLPSSRNARFRDDPSAEEPRYTDADAQEITDPVEAANRAALFSSQQQQQSQPYTDTPPEHSTWDNQQIFENHDQVMREQDEQLDVLGQSVRRQRMLGLQMGEEMEEQNEMLQDVERGVDRHTTTLERARRRLGDVARKGKGNWSWITIAVLVCILILVIKVF